MIEELVEEYKKKVDIINIKGKFYVMLCKVGLAVIYFITLIAFIMQNKNLNNNIFLYLFSLAVYIVILLIASFSLLLFCFLRTTKIIEKYLKEIDKESIDKLKNNFKKLAYIREIYKKFNKRQEEWIMNYCKNKKINTVQKINIIREEIKKEIESSKVKYLNPVIFGTLSLTLWGQVCQIINQEYGPFVMILSGLILASLVCIVIAIIKYMYNSFKETLNLFDEHDTGLKKLDDLLVYALLDQEK